MSGRGPPPKPSDTPQADADATVYAVSTVQEEVGVQGAKMVGFDLAPDVAIAADVTHATDAPGSTGKAATGVELGEGRGRCPREREPSGRRRALENERRRGHRHPVTGDRYPDRDRRGRLLHLPRWDSVVNVGLPNRYMHTPVEVIDPDDLDALATCWWLRRRAAEQAPFSVDV